MPDLRTELATKVLPMIYNQEPKVTAKSEPIDFSRMQFDDAGDAHEAAAPQGERVSRAVVQSEEQEPQTQRYQLYKLLVQHPEGLTTRQLYTIARRAKLRVKSDGPVRTVLDKFYRMGLARRYNDEVRGSYFVATADSYPAKQMTYSRHGKRAAAHPPEAAPKAAPKTAPKAAPSQSLQQLLGSMNVLQARALYEELKKIFG